MPRTFNVSDIKANLLKPATTSHFEVNIPIIDALRVKGKYNPIDQNQIQLLCSEASLPGSNLATFEINNDRMGVTEKHVHRRIFDDRIDLTFYVDAGAYKPIAFFEDWINYITSPAEDAAKDSNPTLNKEMGEYFYRMRYPQGDDGYMAQQGLTVTKFEKDQALGGGALEYKFVNAFPLAINSMPVSYDGSSLLKCTVSMSYIRYIVTQIETGGTENDKEAIREMMRGKNPDPIKQAQINSQGDIPFPDTLGIAIMMGPDGVARNAATGEPI
jgi:hypothetical protein